LNVSLLMPGFLLNDRFAFIQSEVVATFNQCSELAVGKNITHSKIIIRELYKRGLLTQESTATALPTEIIFNAILAEQLARFAAFAAGELVAHQLNFISPFINRYGEHKDNLWQTCINGDLLFSRIFYESTEQFRLGKTATVAKKNIDGWQLNGTLPVMLLGPDTDFHLVLATTDANKLNAFLVPVNAEGIHFISQAPLSFDGQYVIAKAALINVNVGKDAQLADIDNEYLNSLIAKNRIFSSVIFTGRARLNLDALLRFLRTRNSNGQPLINLDVLRHRLAALDAECSMSRAFSYCALATQLDDAEFQSLANGCKFFAAELMQKISREALHLGGITHYRTDSEISQSYRETRWNSFFVEADEILLQNI
jgi:alkylation response protein AidB-like acyl-CoA dehydrogenase